MSDLHLCEHHQHRVPLSVCLCGDLSLGILAQQHQLSGPSVLCLPFVLHDMHRASKHLVHLMREHIPSLLRDVLQRSQLIHLQSYLSRWPVHRCTCQQFMCALPFLVPALPHHLNKLFKMCGWVLLLSAQQYLHQPVSIGVLQRPCHYCQQLCLHYLRQRLPDLHGGRADQLPDLPECYCKWVRGFLLPRSDSPPLRDSLQCGVFRQYRQQQLRPLPDRVCILLVQCLLLLLVHKWGRSYLLQASNQQLMCDYLSQRIVWQCY